MHIPLADGAQAKTEPTAASTPLANLRVLVVDDNHDAGDSLAMLLEMLGAQAQVARSGAEAIEAFPSFRPSVVLMDIGMPGMDGYEAAVGSFLACAPSARGMCMVGYFLFSGPAPGPRARHCASAAGSCGRTRPPRRSPLPASSTVENLGTGKCAKRKHLSWCEYGVVYRPRHARSPEAGRVADAIKTIAGCARPACTAGTSGLVRR